MQWSERVKLNYIASKEVIVSMTKNPYQSLSKWAWHYLTNHYPSEGISNNSLAFSIPDYPSITYTVCIHEQTRYDLYQFEELDDLLSTILSMVI